MLRNKATKKDRQGSAPDGARGAGGSVPRANTKQANTKQANTAQPGAATASPRPAVRRSLAVAGSVAIAVVLWLVGFGLLGLDPDVGSAGQVQEVTLASTVEALTLTRERGWL